MPSEYKNETDNNCKQRCQVHVPVRAEEQPDVEGLVQICVLQLHKTKQ